MATTNYDAMAYKLTWDMAYDVNNNKIIDNIHKCNNTQTVVFWQPCRKEERCTRITRKKSNKSINDNDALLTAPYYKLKLDIK